MSGLSFWPSFASDRAGFLGGSAVLVLIGVVLLALTPPPIISREMSSFRQICLPDERCSSHFAIRAALFRPLPYPNRPSIYLLTLIYFYNRIWTKVEPPVSLTAPTFSNRYRSVRPVDQIPLHRASRCGVQTLYLQQLADSYARRRFFKPRAFSSLRTLSHRIGGVPLPAPSLATCHSPIATAVYRSSGANCEKASGAASSKRVSRLRNTNFTLSVGPLRCFAMINSVCSRSSGDAPTWKKCGR